MTPRHVLGVWGLPPDVGTQSLAAACCAALLGDQVGFQVGRWAGRTAIRTIKRSPLRATPIARAEEQVAEWRGMAVLLSR